MLIAFGILQSPTSSSFGDDDTELMMDELLMAPPMTASAVRGLLPRYVLGSELFSGPTILFSPLLL